MVENTLIVERSLSFEKKIPIKPKIRPHVIDFS